MEDLKSMLKTGMKVILRDGSRFIVILNYCKDGKDYLYSEKCYSELRFYDDDLKCKGFSELDIIEIQSPTLKCSLVQDCIKNKNCFKTIWKREETKEMTVSEIEKALGYKIKVIADKEEKK